MDCMHTYIYIYNDLGGVGLLGPISILQGLFKGRILFNYLNIIWALEGNGASPLSSHSPMDAFRTSTWIRYVHMCFLNRHTQH